MGLLTNLFGKQDMADAPHLETAVAHAVSAVEPLLMQTGGYPDRYRQPVSAALAYARQLADSLPGPVLIDREAYARDAFVHALFPDANAISDAIASSLSMQEYLRRPISGNGFYALMGMRRVDKKFLGMEMAGATLQRDVVQQATYFINHTLENPSPDEALAREMIATSFFHSLVDKVKARIELRRQSKETLTAETNALMPRLRHINDIERAATEERMDKMADELQSTIESLEPEHFLADFEAVLLHPEEHLRLNRTSITLDSMGIRHTADDPGQGKEFMLCELIGYDRRDWNVMIVRCTDLQYETFAEKLDKAYRYLSL
ncbi:MAG: hypothetical protein WAW02_01555 [Sideroxyarcus sp.]